MGEINRTMLRPSVPSAVRQMLYYKCYARFSSATLLAWSPLPLTTAVMAIDAAAPEAGSKKKLLIFDSKEDLAVSLAKYTAELLEKFTAEKGTFIVVLSRGSLINAHM